MPSARRAAAARKEAQAFNNKYDAAGSGRRIRTWNPSSVGPNRATQGLQKIRDRSRDSARNDWAAASMRQKWTTTLVGSGITPRWKKKKFNELWAKHVPTADADGVLNAYAMVALGVSAWFDAGEVFLRRRPRDLSAPLAAPVQYQLIEAEFCPIFDSDTWPGMPEGNNIRQGIERNKYGRRTAYWMYREHPADGEKTARPDQLIRIAASEISHVFEPKRPGQLRGVPELAPMLVRLRSSMDFEDAVLDRQKLANLFVAFVTRKLPETADIQFDQDTGLPKFYDNNGTPTKGLEPGIMQDLMPGEDVKFANPPEAGTTFSEYMRTTHAGTSAGGGMPYELMSGDIQNVSDRTLRVVMQEFRRFARQRQWHLIIPMLSQPMVDWWADASLLAGTIALDELAEAKAPTWAPEGWEYIHPVQDAQGKKLLIEAGIVSRDSVIGERGDDPEAVDEERLAGQDREDKMGLPITGVETPAPAAGANPNDPNAGDPAPAAKPATKPVKKAEREALIAQQRIDDAALVAHDARVAEAQLADARDQRAYEIELARIRASEAAEVQATERARIAAVSEQQAADRAAETERLALELKAKNERDERERADALEAKRIDAEAERFRIEAEREERAQRHAETIAAIAASKAEVNVHVPPSQIANQVDVASPVVHVPAPIVNVENKVDVTLPTRETTSVIDRDADGNITEVTQTERTIQ